MAARPAAALLLALALPGASSAADLKVGVTLSATGPLASIGLPVRNAVALLPPTLGGVPVEYLVLDDATDATTAVKNVRKLTGESAVDVVLGSTSTPGSLAMLDVVAETGTPMISLAGGKRVVAPMDEKRRWAFKTAQNDDLMASAFVEHMARRGVKTVAYIGFSDAYGDGWWTELSRLCEERKIQVVASERYGRTDTSVTGQVLKIVAARPDAVLVGAAGTPAVLPQKTLLERGYKGLVYHTHGVVNPDFLRVGGKDVEGAYLAVGPEVLARQLPDDHPAKGPALEFVARYDARYGPGTASSFAALVWDAGLLLQAAVPVALKKAAPGTPAFRAALRDALEGIRDLHGAHGVYTMGPADHHGLDARARVMARIQGGAWVLDR